jgi:HSP20 family molecular chaperone IbpA
MRPVGAEKRSRAGEKLNIVAMDANEQTRRIHAAIARRAYEIFENRGSGAHEQEDWRQAESELVMPLICGRTTLGDNLWVGSDAAPFQDGTINIWVAPRRLTICGKPHVKRRATAMMESSSRREEEMIFRIIGLPVEVDPSRVTAGLNGTSVEIFLRKTQAKLEQEARAAAA